MRTTKKKVDDVDPDILRMSRSLAVMNYCYKQDACSKDCALAEFCRKQVQRGTDFGHFEEMGDSELKEAMTIVNGEITIKFGAHHALVITPKVCYETHSR